MFPPHTSSRYKGDQRPIYKADVKVLKMLLCSGKHLFWVKYSLCQRPDSKRPELTTGRVSKIWFTHTASVVECMVISSALKGLRLQWQYPLFLELSPSHCIRYSKLAAALQSTSWFLFPPGVNLWLSPAFLFCLLRLSMLIYHKYLNLIVFFCYCYPRNRLSLKKWVKLLVYYETTKGPT